MSRAVRVVTDVAAVDRAFDDEVPVHLDHVNVGDRIRVNFHNRSVKAWVVGESEGIEGVALKPVAKWSGFGPPPEMLDLLEWASWRWVAPLARFLTAASPIRNITSLPHAPTKPEIAATEFFAPGIWQLAPTVDPLALIISAYEQTRENPGSFLVLVPTEAWAQRLRGRLEQRGLSVAYGDDQWDRMRAGWPVIVGVRGTALAPTPRVAGAVIIDADDDAYRSEGSPTWHAATMLHERVRRDGGAFWATSALPSPSLLSMGPLHDTLDTPDHWPAIDIIDRRGRDPHEGVLAEPALALAHQALSGSEDVAVAVILQRLGTGRLFACRKCGDLARCVTCGQPEQERDGVLTCPEGHESRENFCRACAATNLRRVQSGVTTLARDVSLQLRQPVSEVTASTTSTEVLHRVVVGTEAVLQRVRRCTLVVFVDFDQYLLAPREAARREALSAIVRAGRLVGSRSDHRGTLVVQTRRSDDVITALAARDVRPLRDEDVDNAQALGLAPYGATAEISGEGAEAFLASLDATRVRIRTSNGVSTVRASDIETLCDVLRSGTRGSGKMRLAVQ